MKPKIIDRLIEDFEQGDMVFIEEPGISIDLPEVDIKTMDVLQDFVSNVSIDLYLLLKEYYNL